MNDRETIPEILDDMRRAGALMRRRICAILLNYADRIEAAAKREKSEIEADALAVGGIVEASRHTPGNAAAMRDAIEPWVAFGEWLLENAGKEGLGAAIREYGPIIRQRLEELRAALINSPKAWETPYAVQEGAGK